MFEGKGHLRCHLYTLRMQHVCEIFELAQHKVARSFEYKTIDYQEDENGDVALDDLDEEFAYT